MGTHGAVAGPQLRIPRSVGEQRAHVVLLVLLEAIRARHDIALGLDEFDYVLRPPRHIMVDVHHNVSASVQRLARQRGPGGADVWTPDLKHHLVLNAGSVQRGNAFLQRLHVGGVRARVGGGAEDDFHFKPAPIRL